jgi:6-pyruvoyltetrahydropterin/6-carboxytetrahydropterin synthase
MFSISKDFQFCASHQLTGLPEGHQCARLHGHNYTVKIELSLDNDLLYGPGWVRDYGDLDVVKRWIDDTLDHRHLNDALPERNPTAELLAIQIWEKAAELLRLEFGPIKLAVGVSETPKTWAFYRP